MSQITMIGCGEVGLAYAEALLELTPAPELQLFDPRPPPAAARSPIGSGCRSRPPRDHGWRQ